MEPTQRYVMARDITQANKTIPPAMQADVWLSGTLFDPDDEAEAYVSLEVKPAWGQIASVRLSMDELRDLGTMILDRLGVNVVEGGLGPNVQPVQVTVPKGALIEVTYLGNTVAGTIEACGCGGNTG